MVLSKTWNLLFGKLTSILIHEENAAFTEEKSEEGLIISQ
jgi:hypothetical protein